MLEIRMYNASSFGLFFFLKTDLALRGFLFRIYFGIVFSISVTNTKGILTGIDLNLYITLGSWTF